MLHSSTSDVRQYEVAKLRKRIDVIGARILDPDHEQYVGTMLAEIEDINKRFHELRGHMYE